MKASKFIFFLLVILLASCNGFASTPTTSPEMETAIAKLWTAYAETQTAIPTITPSPSQSPTPTPTLSPAHETKAAFYNGLLEINTKQAAFLFTEVPGTLQARRVICNDGFALERFLDVLRYSTSEWTIYTCSPKLENIGDWRTPGVVDYGTRYTQVSKTDFSRTWTIRHNVFDYSIIDRPDAWLFPYRWTVDGKYLYLCPLYYPSGSGYPTSVALQTLLNDLYRINLETGYFELVLSGNQYGAFSLSPDDQTLFYSDHDRPDILFARNMGTGEERFVKLNETIIAAGAFVWNMDGSKIVVTVGYETQSGGRRDDLSATAIYVVTLRNMHAQMILPRDSRVLIPSPCFENQYWLDENTLCLSPSTAINIQTGEVLSIPPPP